VLNLAGCGVYIWRMLRNTCWIFLLLGAGLLEAQDPGLGACAVPDSIVVRGNRRLEGAAVLADAGLVAGVQLNYRLVQRAVRQLYATGNFDSVDFTCHVAADESRSFLAITVEERPLLERVEVRGPRRVSPATVRAQAELPQARPLDPSQVARAIFRIDSTYKRAGFYLARIRAETTAVEGGVALTFHVSEGPRLAVSGIDVVGNRVLRESEIVGAMKIKPEGFWWWRRGELDDEALAGDLAERIPRLYASRGFIDFRLAYDTVIVDPERGKALVEFGVAEGPQYKVGDFEVVGSRHFSSEEIRAYYPFADQTRPLAARITDFLRRRPPVPGDVFDARRWEEATDRIRQAYANDGYIYASVRPVVEREVAPDSTHYVHLRWEVEEQSPAVINRVEIVGNDYTSESCIRDQLVILPGDVFNQERLIRSWQSIANLGFFETPLPPPDTRRANDQGDVDIIFRVKEKRTGNVNFGASMGQGTGLGGFIGLDQPNLFGKCKRGSLQWQFGRYFNDFNMSYSDPRLAQSMISGSISLYRTMARYYIADLGRSLRTGGQLQVGFPVPWDVWSRLFVSYGAEGVRFGDQGLLGQTAEQFGGTSFRSSAGLTYARDTRVGMPFPTGGSSQTIGSTFSGGPLGGQFSFQRFTAEMSAFVPLGQLGGTAPGSQPAVFTAGLTTRAGAVFGNTGPFFFTQEFALGGVQYGERLRGYEEFSITPDGYVTGTNSFNAQRSSFGKAFFTTTAELGLRVNQSLYLNTFFEAGNLWRRVSEMNPTRLFRGIGVGASTITPLGPLGLDYALGLDRLNAQGRRAPKWQLHFRFGQLF
jgi:outer membrane protein insertion porin family